MKAEKFWDKVSKNSDKKLSKASQITINNTIKYLNPPDELLDYGCGNGRLTKELSSYVRQVTGVDISQEAINIASNNQPNAIFIQGDIFTEELNEKTYDVICCYNVLHYMTDLSKVLEQIYMLLKPNGLFISSTACMGDVRSISSSILKGLTGVHMIPKMNFYKAQDLIDEVNASGFHLIDQVVISKGFNETFIVGRK